jgi:hypothetical protein
VKLVDIFSRVRQSITMCKKAFVSQNGCIHILRPVSDTQRSKYYDFVV